MSAEIISKGRCPACGVPLKVTADGAERDRLQSELDQLRRDVRELVEAGRGYLDADADVEGSYTPAGATALAHAREKFREALAAFTAKYPSWGEGAE